MRWFHYCGIQQRSNRPTLFPDSVVRAKRWHN